MSSKKAKSKAVKKGANAFPPKSVPFAAAAESSDDSDSSEEEVKMPVTASAVKPAKFQNTAESESDEELDSEDLDESDDEVKAGQQVADVGGSDEDDDDDEDVDDDADDDDDDDDDDSEAEEDEMDTPASVNIRKMNAAGMPKDEDDEEDDDDDEDDDEGEESDSEMDEGDDNDDDEDSEADEDEDEDDDEEDEEEGETSPGNKRKLPSAAAASVPTKKPKTDTSSTGKELFVRGFPQDVADEKIKKFFDKKGVTVAHVKRIKGKQFCFVELVNAGDVPKAVQLSGQEFKGSALTVAVSQKKSQPETPGKKQEKTGKAGKASVQQHTDKGDNKTTVFVKNLAWATTEDALKELFAGCKNVRLPKRPDGSSRGFAFIEFDTEEAASAAIEEHNDEEVDGRELHVSPADIGGRSTPQKSSEGPKAETKTVIVQNLSYETTEDSLKLLFDDAVTCRLITHDDSGKSKGFAFAEFDSVDDAKKAVENINGKTFEGRQIRVDFAQEKGSGDGRRGRGGFRGGRGGFRGGRGGGGDRGGGQFRGGRGGDRGKFRGGRGARGGRGRGGFKSKD